MNPQPPNGTQEPQQTQPIQPIAPVNPVSSPVIQDYSAPKKKGRFWLWFAIPFAVILLFFGGMIALTAFAAIQARSVATEFMDAVKANDSNKIEELSGSGPDGVTQKATAGLKNASYTVKDATYKKDVGHVVNFDVMGSDTVKDTTVIVAKSKVTTFNINSSGGEKSSETSTTTGACLTEGDLKSSGISYIDQSSLDSGSRSGNGTYLGELFFKPDSREYLSMNASTEIDKLAKVYENNKSKSFFYMVRGSVRESSSTAAGIELAMQRANKIKADFVSRGVPADLVKVYQPVSGASSMGDDVDRRIDVNINVSGCGTNNRGM